MESRAATLMIPIIHERGGPFRSARRSRTRRVRAASDARVRAASDARVRAASDARVRAAPDARAVKARATGEKASATIAISGTYIRRSAPTSVEMGRMLDVGASVRK